MVNKLEVTWTLLTVALITGVAVYSTILVYKLDALPANPTEYVDVTGHQWYWQFDYPANGTNCSSDYDASTNSINNCALWAPPGAVVQVNVTGADVIHSFNIPQLGVRIDAIPDRVNHFAFTVPDAAPGTRYLIQCTEFCGTFHGTMRSFLEID